MAENLAIANEPREEVEAFFAARMIEVGFHVFIGNTDKLLTYDMVLSSDFESRIYTAPVAEVEQNRALETLCTRFDNFNDSVSSYIDSSDIEISLKDYAKKMYDNKKECLFKWRDFHSDWENIRDSLLSGETDYLRHYLDDVSVYPKRAAHLLEDLNQYETTYGYRAFGSSNEQEKIRAEENLTVERDVVSEDDAHLFFEQSNLGEYYEKIRGEGHTGFSITQDFSHLMINITVSNQRGTKNTFDVTSVGFDTEKRYTVAEFNQALKNANEIWQERWDGLSYPNDTVIVTIENLHTDPCTYRVNLADADFNSIQDIVKFSPTPMHASISTDKAIAMLNAAEHIPQVIAKPEDKSAAELKTVWTPVLESENDEGRITIFSTIYDGDNYWISEKPNGRFDIETKWGDRVVTLGMEFEDFTSRADAEEFFKENIENYLSYIYQVEHIPQQQDISHNTTNAVPTAIRGESRGKVMEQNTKFEVSTMHKLEGDGPAKAIATLVVNGEFAVHGVKVVEGKNGLYAAMPSERQGNGEYKDVVFPVTSEARTAIENAMLDAYEKLSASPEQSLKNEIAAPEKPVSKVYAQMHEVKSDNTQTKAAGQLTIDSCLVVTGVKLNEGTNSQGQTKNFVAMPARMNANGAYDDVAHPITADFHNTVEKSVMASVNNIGRYEYKGVKFEELGENPAKSAALHPKFADKLMEQLDKAGIPYQAKCAERTIISVAAENKPKFDTIKKDLTDKLNAKDKPQQTQEQKQTTGTHSKSKK